jgi:hypothetical protein
MEEKKSFLVVMGVPSIKKYVFGTDRLVEIRGASALLDDLNTEATDLFLRGQLGENDVNCVFAGGGSAQFIVVAAEKDLDKCLHALRGYYHKKSKGELQLVCGKAELLNGNYRTALDKALLESGTERQENPFIPCSSIHTGFIRECDSCSEMASRILSHEGEQRLLCNSCYEKTDYTKVAKSRLWQNLSDYFSTRGFSTARPRNFEEIGEQNSTAKGYTALIYADGNAMGKMIDRINSWEHFKLFSETVERSIRDACHEALCEVFFSAESKMPKKLPAEILLLGGDDLVVYLTAESALSFAIRVAEKFNEKTKKRFADSNHSFFRDLLKEQGMSLSLGIAFGRSHTPISILMNQAEELLNNAKRAGSENQNPENFFPSTYIDYHFSSYYNQLSVEDSRANHLQLKGIKPILLYRKPYSLEDAKMLLQFARNFVDTQIPKTRLHGLGKAPSLGKVNGTLECIKIYARTRKGKQRLTIWEALAHFGCIRNMPWNEENELVDSTMIVDLIELTGFCGKDLPEIKGGIYAP